MIGTGTLINIVAILAGGTLGSLMGHRLSEKSRSLTTDVLGLVTLLSAALSAAAILSADLEAAVGNTWPLFIVLGSLLIGGFVGNALMIEERIETMGERLKARFARNDSSFVEGFLVASLLFCIGPLAILGAFDDALGAGIDKLVLKSVLDFFASIAFAASFGWGVAVSALAVGLYQGVLTAAGFLLGQIWDTAQIDAMTSVGGLLLFGIALKLLNIKHIPIGNLLPALFLAPLAVSLVQLL
jgi:uncharacterized membrane protein YqgA involved in biofilm formation